MPFGQRTRVTLRSILPIVIGLLTLYHPAPAQAAAATDSLGTIIGRALDAEAGRPLGGATVELGPTDRRTRTDSTGHFEFGDLEPGRYTVTVTFVGFAPDTLRQVRVRPDRTTSILAHLSPLPIEGGTIIVTGAVDPHPVPAEDGTVTVSAEQIRTLPGAMGDISRAVAGTATIARFDDRYSSLIVRGGSPMENGFYINGIPVPSISHFPSQGSAGGPLGLLNSGIISSADFYTAGFPVMYGNRLSSILEISLRDGNRRSFAGEGALAITGASVILEGPLANGRGSWLVSGRHSFLDLLRKAVDFDATPNYDDVYSRLTIDHDSTSSFELIGLLGRGSFKIGKNVSHETGFDFYGQMSYATGTVGLGWNKIRPTGGTSSLSVTLSSVQWSNENRFVVSDDSLYDNNSREHSLTVRSVNTRPIGQRITAHYGAEISYVAADYDFVLGEYTHETGYLNPPVTVVSRPDYVNGGVWFSQDWRIASFLTATTGLRFDEIGYPATAHVSPRLGLRTNPRQDLTIYSEAGVYYQALPLTLVLQRPANQNLRDLRTLNLVGGVRWQATSVLHLNVESYFKRYDYMPMDTTQPAVFVLDELIYNYGFVAGHLPLVDDGRSLVYGLETSVSLRPMPQLFCRLGLAWSRARYRGTDDIWRDRIIDNRIAADFELDWRPTRRWTFSSRWIFGGGRPYTPYNEPKSRFYNFPIYELDQPNSARYPDYHSLNLRLERSFGFGGSEMSVYFEVWNVYDRRNVAGQYWDQDYREVRSVRQFPRLPIMGLEYRF